MNKDRKSTVKKSVFAIIILALLIALIGGTYARYVSTATGNGSVDIAKWAVKIGEKDISDGSSATFDLQFTANNANTVANKVAPGGSAVAYVDIDLTGTEVSVNFNCALDESAATNLTTVFGENYADKVEVSVGTPALEGTTSNMTIDTDKKIVTVGTAAMSGKVRVPITLTWKNDNDANNSADTNTGALQTGVEIPVKLTVQQHVAEQV